MSESTTVRCTASPEEIHARRVRVRETIVPHVATVAPIVNGLRIDFEPSDGLRSLIEEFIALEQTCCHFLTFTLSRPAQGLSLQVQGPPEAAHVIDMFRRTAQGHDQCA